MGLNGFNMNLNGVNMLILNEFYNSTASLKAYPPLVYQHFFTLHAKCVAHCNFQIWSYALSTPKELYEKSNACV